MIVLDADSLVSGRAMVQLASVMDRAPGVGLIQTIPTVINSRTLFARWQQFAASSYGTLAGACLICWSGSVATFCGYNAIFRVRAYPDSSRPPDLLGQAHLAAPMITPGTATYRQRARRHDDRLVGAAKWTQ